MYYLFIEIEIINNTDCFTCKQNIKHIETRDGLVYVYRPIEILPSISVLPLGLVTMRINDYGT